MSSHRTRRRVVTAADTAIDAVAGARLPERAGADETTGPTGLARRRAGPLPLLPPTPEPVTVLGDRRDQPRPALVRPEP